MFRHYREIHWEGILENKGATAHFVEEYIGFDEMPPIGSRSPSINTSKTFKSK